MDTHSSKPVKKQITFIFVLMFVGLSGMGQTSTQILSNEMAFSTHLFCRIEYVPTTDGSGASKPLRVPHSNAEGFIYLNIPDSLIVIHNEISEDEVAISERFKILNIKKTDPIVLSALTESNEAVIINIIPHAGTFVQVYYPETKIDLGHGEQMMAFEFLELKPLGNARKFLE